MGNRQNLCVDAANARIRTLERQLAEAKVRIRHLEDACDRGTQVARAIAAEQERDVWCHVVELIADKLRCIPSYADPKNEHVVQALGRFIDERDALRRQVEGLTILRKAIFAHAEAICPKCGWVGDFRNAGGDGDFCPICCDVEIFEPCDFAQAIAALPTAEKEDDKP